MKLDINDPKWTAYAFGELDAQERAAVEAELRDNAAAVQFVSELQQTGELLKSALAKEPVARLTDEQRATLAASVNDQSTSVGSHSADLPSMQSRPRHRRRLVAALGAVAASGVIVAFLLPALQSAREAGSRIAKKKTTTTTHADNDKSVVNILSDEGEVHSIQTHEGAPASTLNSAVLTGEQIGQSDSYGQTVRNRGYGATGDMAAQHLLIQQFRDDSLNQAHSTRHFLLQGLRAQVARHPAPVRLPMISGCPQSPTTFKSRFMKLRRKNFQLPPR